MSYTETENLKLRKDNGDEKIVDWRTHSNANMDTIDEAVQNLVEVCANAKSLLGQLGLDESGNPLISAASARTTLGAATSGGASNTLYAAEQSIATNAGNIATLQNSVSQKKDLSSISSLDDLPRNGFGYIASIPSSLRPISELSAALYLMISQSDAQRSLILFRYGNTQAWINTRNNTGWHGWESIVGEPKLLKTGTVNGITAKAYQSGGIVNIAWDGTLTNEVAGGAWIQDLLTGLPVPLSFTSIWQSHMILNGTEHYDSRVINDNGGRFAMVARAKLPKSSSVRGTMTYTAAI